MSSAVKKDNRIEIIRIIAIILVIILHVTNRYLLKISDIKTVNNFILMFVNSVTRVSVPLFFMISGIVNLGKEFDKKKYVSKILRMIIILIVWTFIYYFAGNYKVINLFHALFSFIKPILWYMYALIGLYIATPFLTKMIKNLNEEEKRLFIKLWIVLSGLYYLFKVILGLLGVDTNISHPIPIFGATYYLGYYVAGYLIYENLNKLKYKNTSMSLIAVLCILLNTILTFVFSIKKHTYYQGFFGYSNILIMLPSIIMVIMCLRLIKDKDYKVVKYVCPYIFGIYLSHILVLEFILKNIKISNVFIGCICYSVITFVVTYILIYIIKKIPYINKYIC